MAAGSALVLGLHSLIAKLPFPLLEVLATTLVAYVTSLAFLSIVFVASAFARRTPVAAGIALLSGFALAGVLTLLGFNGTALAGDLFTNDGTLQTGRLMVEVALCSIVAVAGLGGAVFEVERRGSA